MHAHRMSLLLIFTIVLTGISAAGMYLFKSPVPKPHKPSPVSIPISPIADETADIPADAPIVPSSNAVWDLAMNYYRNGFYDKSTEQFEKILETDPDNESAKKYLELIEKKKTIRYNSRARNQQAALPAVLKPGTEPPMKKPTKSSPTGRKSKSADTGQLPVQEPTKNTRVISPKTPETRAVQNEGRINFEFEHNFPSGNFYVYANGKLLYQGALSAKKKRVLVFTDYTGRLSGSMQVPTGELELRLQAISPEVGVSVEKRLRLNVAEGQAKNLWVKFIKISKQLETRWI
jgi:hypothetical protein